MDAEWSRFPMDMGLSERMLAARRSSNVSRPPRKIVPVMPYAGHTTEEIARRGKGIYERKLHRETEREHRGRFVVVDVKSGDYEIAD